MNNEIKKLAEQYCGLSSSGARSRKTYEFEAGNLCALVAAIQSAERESCAVALEMLGFDEAAAVVRARGNTQRSNAGVTGSGEKI